jgi:hypothetical protein
MRRPGFSAGFAVVLVMLAGFGLVFVWVVVSIIAQIAALFR